MRLADAPVLPFQFTNLAETASDYVREIRKLVGSPGKVNLAPLQDAVQALAKSAKACEDAFDQACASGDVFTRRPAQLQDLNQALYRTERVLTAPEGLPGRPWFKHQLYAPGFYTGYGVKTIPYVREAIEQQHWQEAVKGVEVVSRRLLALAAQIDGAAALLRTAR